MLYSLDPEILELCDELESLGGGIQTRIEPIQAQSMRKNEFKIESQILEKSLRNNYNSTFVLFNQRDEEKEILNSFQSQIISQILAKISKNLEAPKFYLDSQSISFDSIKRFEKKESVI